MYHPCPGDSSCSNQGTCDVSSGACDCDSGFLGDTCNCKSADCFLMIVNTGYCSEFNCLESGAITSPGFPGHYGNNLDLTWLIQLKMGQKIEISFLSFALELQSGNPTTTAWWYKSNYVETYW